MRSRCGREFPCRPKTRFLNADTLLNHKKYTVLSVGTRVGEDSIHPIAASVAREPLDVQKALQKNTQRKHADVKRFLSNKIKRLETKIEKNCKTFAG